MRSWRTLHRVLVLLVLVTPGPCVFAQQADRAGDDKAAEFSVVSQFEISGGVPD